MLWYVLFLFRVRVLIISVALILATASYIWLAQPF
jgi:hypothetical protein